jgi:hypothetical protein
MGLPLVIAAAFAAGCGLYYKYKNDQELEAKTQVPGDAYNLPPCCIAVLRQSSNNGTVATAIGAFVGTASLVGSAQPGKPSLKSVESTAKSGYDAGGTVLMNWDEEASLHSDFMNGIIALVHVSMIDLAHEHYLKHAREDSQANKFWTKLYERKKARLPQHQRGLQEAFDSIDR